MATRKKTLTPAAHTTATPSPPPADWNPLWDTLRAWDPAFLDAYLALRNVPIKQGPLPAKTKEFILIALNAATTHLYAPGVRRHLQNALRLGATRAELLEVIELTTLLGIHGCNLAVPILAEEWERHSAATNPAEATEVTPRKTGTRTAKRHSSRPR